MDCHKYIVTTYQMLMSLMSFFFNTFQLHVCFCVSQGPEVGCVEGDSCHTGLQRHPGLCPSDQCCRLRDSCRAHSEPLEKDTNTDKNAFPVAFTRLLHVKATLPANTLSLFLDRAYPLWKLNWIKNKIKIKPNEKYKAIANLVTEQLLPSPSMSMLQASPSPLSSVSVCSGLLSNGQLSQRSPTPSLSESNCRGLYTDGQLSYAKHTHIHAYIHTGDVNICLFSVIVSSKLHHVWATVSPSHLWCHHCHHQDHRHLPVRLGPGLPVQSLEAWGNYPAASHTSD